VYLPRKAPPDAGNASIKKADPSLRFGMTNEVIRNKRARGRALGVQARLADEKKGGAIFDRAALFVSAENPREADS
jgi:hypothetical protein